MASAEQFVRVHRQIDIRSLGGIHAEELRRRYAYHGERQVVDENRLARRVSSASETP